MTFKWSDKIQINRTTFTQRCIKFPKIQEVPKILGPQTGDMNSVTQWGFTSIRRHRAKFSRLGVLALECVHSCITYIHTDILPRQMNNILTSYKLLKIYNRVHVTVNLDCAEVLKSRQIAILYEGESIIIRTVRFIFRKKQGQRSYNYIIFQHSPLALQCTPSITTQSALWPQNKRFWADRQTTHAPLHPVAGPW